MSENELTQAFEQAWAPFRAAVDKADLDRATSAGWTVKEMLSHVAFWDETVTPVIAMLLRGGDMPGPDQWPGFASGFEAPNDGTWPHFEIHNAREAEWGRGQSNETIVDRLDKAHAQAAAAIAALTPDEVQNERFRGYVLGEKIGHYEEHLAELAGSE
jgi:Mycothiol maleylpyruvate isomerase N-terminal domain